MSVFTKIKSYFQGTAHYTTYRVSLIIALVVLSIFITVAALLFSPTYRISEKTISELDSLTENPIGTYFFKAAFIITGLWFLPITLNIMRSMRTHSPILGALAGFFYFVSGSGLILIAFFPIRVSLDMHIVGASFGFGGLFTATIMTLISIGLEMKISYNKKAAIYSAIYYGPFVFIYLLTIITSGIPLLVSLAQGTIFGEFIPYGWFVLEWMMFITGLFALIGTQKIMSKLMNKAAIDVAENNKPTTGAC